MNIILAGIMALSTVGSRITVNAVDEIQVQMQMREEIPPFTRIGSVAPSLPSNLGTKLHFLTDSSFFSVTPNTGEVRVARSVDRERLCPEFKLCCGVIACQIEARLFVTNKATGDFAVSVNLKVDIQDQNDNRPTFSQPKQTVSLSEASQVGTYISLIPAADADIEPANQIQRYTLLEPTGTFVLDVTELPAVRLQLTRPLDRESTSSYTASLEACDPGACARQTLDIQILDENDNKPTFTSTRITKRLMENIKVGTVILHLNATDPDSGDRGRVLYTLHGNVDADLLDMFEFVRDTGEVRLKKPLAANIRDNYRFKVVACNAINPSCSGDENSTADVTLLVEDINNFAPSIHVVPSGGALKAAEANPEETDTRGDASFREGLRVLENNPPSQVAVLTVKDDDLGENARVNCRLNVSAGSKLDPNYSDDFILTPSAPGIYSLRAARMFDHEVEPTVNTRVVCHDYGKPQQLTSVRLITVNVVDTNEFQPEFSRRVYVGRVPENAPAGMEIVTATATDRDRGAQLQYHFATPADQQGQWEATQSGQNTRTISKQNSDELGANKYFTIDEESGTIRTSQIPLDREVMSSVTLTVLVTDSKLPPIFTATTTVSIEILDENDNAPVFVNPPTTDVVQSATGLRVGRRLKSFQVVENAPRFTRLSEQLSARDPDQGDNGRIHFSLVDTYAFTRSAHFNQQSNNQVDLASTLGSIEEQLPSDITGELGLSRKVVDHPIFQITPDGGIETLVELDRETVPTYILKVSVQDRGVQPLTSTAMIRVDVLDSNDNAPFWIFPTPIDRTINITTAMKPGSLAGRLRAEDADEGDAGRVDYLFLGPRGEPLKAVSLHEGLLNGLSQSKGTGKQTETMPKRLSSSKTEKVKENGYRVGPLYLNGSTGEIWVAQSLTSGTINLHLRAQDRGTPKSQTDAWLTMNVFLDPSEDPSFFSFGADGTLNVTIILVMITITAIVSLFLIIGIVCVRRRPVRYSQASGNALGERTSPAINATAGYPVDYNKEAMTTNMPNGSWPSPLGIYPTPQYYPNQGSLGSPVLEDGQMFTTMGGPGMMGYGPMMTPSETASLIYMQQAPPPLIAMGHPGGTAMNPIPTENGIGLVDYVGHGQMHSFGTLTRNRGSNAGGIYAGSTACGVPYEPHLDAESGDSGRGPSEEGNQFLFSENYRNALNIPGTLGNHPYNTYAGYRPSSRTGCYINAPDSFNGMVKLHNMNCPTAISGGPCTCYMHPEQNVVYSPVHQQQQLFNPNEYNPAIYPTSFVTPLPPVPPPRSPLVGPTKGSAEHQRNAVES
ncbi:unnamed protein product, partial [Dicrocoelium dendriticum]